MANEAINTGGEVQDRVSPKNSAHDLHALKAFISALTGSPDTRVTWQTFDDNKARKAALPNGTPDPFAKVMRGTADDCFPQLSDLNILGAGIFITVQQTSLTGRRNNENIVAIRAFINDFDTDDAIELAKLAADKLPISIEVESSPGKRHLYWLTQPGTITLPEYTPFIEQLVAVNGADPSAKDLARVLRAPGFFHMKNPDKPYMVRMLTDNSFKSYSKQEVADAFGIDLNAINAKVGRNADRAAKRCAETSAATDYDSFEYMITPRDETLLRDALTHLDPKPYGTWMTVGGALSRSGEVGAKLFIEWSARADNFVDAEDCLTKLDNLAVDTPSRYPVIFDMAKAAGWDMQAAMRAKDEDFINEASFIAWADLVPMVKIAWFWKHRLAIGMLHLLGGTPGTGKSTIAFTWASIISSGGTFPDGARAPKGKVLIWSGEDSYEATIKPRLVAAGADMANIGFLNQPRALKDGTKVDFNPAEHLPALMAEIERMPQGEVAMLIIDPIVTVIGDKDNNSTSEVRAALAPLVAMLDKLGIIGLGIMHFTKGSETKDPKDRFNGSSGYIALARVGFAVVKDQNEENRHILTVAKSNIGPEGGGHSYHIDMTEVHDPIAGDIEASRIVWDDVLEGDARTLIRDAEVIQRIRPANKLERAKEFLRNVLRLSPKLVDELKGRARNEDLGWRTMETAKGELGIISERSDPHNNHSPWHWRMPARGAEFFEIA